MSEEDITKAAVRLFTTRYKLGMMDGQRSPFDTLGLSDIDTPQSNSLALEAALLSMVLL